MRNRLFYVQNAGHTMRNTVLYFYSHCAILLIYRRLLCMLWEYEKWKWEIVYKPHKTIYNALVNNKKQRIAKNKQHKTTKSGGNIYYENFGI